MSNPTPLGKQQLEEFDKNGYLFFPNSFSAEETQVLKQAALDVYQMQREEVWRESSG
ncbi:MAG: proline hydroxylase, partial [Gammaproteobacteria bacterium]